MTEADTRETHEGKLLEFFPPDDPDSAWLLRLMIIRDDLAFEMNGLKLHADDGPERVWQTTYFLRRISVSLLEATSIFQHDVARQSSAPQRTR